MLCCSFVVKISVQSLLTNVCYCLSVHNRAALRTLKALQRVLPSVFVFIFMWNPSIWRRSSFIPGFMAVLTTAVVWV